jgi:GT2 family glycosyltransferase
MVLLLKVPDFAKSRNDHQILGCFRLMIFCKHDLDTQKHDLTTLSRFQILDSKKHTIESSQDFLNDRVICLIMDCQVLFDSDYFELLEVAFKDPNLTALYTDFECQSESSSEIFRIRPPNWSPERYLSNDFLGPVFALDFQKLDENLKPGKLTRTQLLLACISNGSKVRLMNQVGYAVSPENLNLNVESRKDEVNKFLSDFRPGSKVATSNTPWLMISNSGLAPKVISIVIPTRGTKKSLLNGELVVNCVKSLQKQELENSRVEVIVVFDSDSKLKYLKKLRKFESEKVSISLVSYDPPFNFARKCNIGAQSASGEVILFLNDDTIFIDSGALLELAGTAMIKEVGAVGAKLLFENESIQHAGYILREGFVGHAYIKDNDGFGPFGDLVSTHEVVGVTGACLAQRKEIWETIGKWNESFPSSYNDVDYCFRIAEAGFSILQVNQAKLRHFESVTRNPKVYPREREMIEQLWGHKFIDEPFFRMAVTKSEARVVQKNVATRYFHYARATYRRQGLVGLWELLVNFSSKTLISKQEKK